MANGITYEEYLKRKGEKPPRARFRKPVSLGETVIKGLSYFDKPQQFIQSRLAPAVFGTKTYKEGYQKLGVSPKVAGALAFGTELFVDPLNLIPAGAFVKAGRRAKGLLKYMPKMDELTDIARYGKILTKPIAEIAGEAPKISRIGKLARKIPGVELISRSPFWRSTRGILKATAPGKRLARYTDEWFNRTQKASAALFRHLDDVVGKYDDRTIAKALDYREGLIKKVSPEAKELAGRLTKIFDDIAKVAGDLGLTTGRGVPYSSVNQLTLGDEFLDIVNRINPETYVPHAIDKVKLATNRDRFIKYMVKTGQMNEGTATVFADKLIRGEPFYRAIGDFLPKARKAGWLEKPRLFDLPRFVLRRDKNLLYEYVENTTRRLAQTAVFGKNNERFDELAKLLRIADPDKADAVLLALKRQLRIAPRDIGAEKVSSAIRRFQGYTKLGRAGISNLNQTINTASTVGLGHAGREFALALGKDKNSIEFAEITGVLLESALRDMWDEVAGYQLASKYKKGGDLLSWVRRNAGRATSPGFQAGEVLNRRVAANAGKWIALEEFDKALKGSRRAIRNLEGLGVDVATALKRGKLSADDVIDAARKVVADTQFLMNPIDLPPYWSTPWGRVVFQFKTFALKQAGFWNKLVGEAVRGNPFPLMTYLVYGGKAGQVTGYVKSLITGQEFPEEPGERYLTGISGVGGAGILQDMIESARRGTFSAYSFIGGPTAGDIAEIMSATGALTKGKFAPLGRKAIKTIPVFGRRLQREFLPTKAQKKKKSIKFTPGSTLLPRF